MLNQISKIAVQSQADTSNVVIMDNIMEGVEGSAIFGYSVAPESLQVTDKQTQQVEHQHVFDVRVLRVSDEDPVDGDLVKLKIMEANKDPVKVTAKGQQGFVIFHDEGQMIRSPYFDEVLGDQFFIARKTGVGYVGAAPDTRQPVISSENILAIWDVQQGSSKVLNGMTLEAGATGSCTGSTQSVVFSIAQDALLSQAVLMPFVGMTLTASLTASTVTGDYRVGLRFLDGSQAELSDSYATFSGTGRQSHTATIPASTVYVQFYVTNEGTLTASDIWDTSTEVFDSTLLWWITGNADILSFSLPAIRINGTTFTE